MPRAYFFHYSLILRIVEISFLFSYYLYYFVYYLWLMLKGFKINNFLFSILLKYFILFYGNKWLQVLNFLKNVNLKV